MHISKARSGTKAADPAQDVGLRIAFALHQNCLKEHQLQHALTTLVTACTPFTRCTIPCIILTYMLSKCRGSIMQVVDLSGRLSVHQ